MAEDDPTDSIQAPASIANNIAQNVARMTFSTGNQTQSGFTPEKDTDHAPSKDIDRTKVNNAKKDLNSVLNVPEKRTGVVQPKTTDSGRGESEALEGAVGGAATSLSTPKKEASGFGLQAPPLHKSASK